MAPTRDDPMPRRDDAPSAYPGPDTDGGGNDAETLVETAYRALRHDIIAGIRAPGERMRIDRLRTLYGIGPTPLREALQRLAADGMVHVLGRRGFQVAPLNAAEFLDLNTARTAVETAALRLSLVNGDDDWEARVVAAAYSLEKQDKLLPRGGVAEFDRWEVLNARFHATLVEACGSRWLLRVRAALHDQCERYRRISVHSAQRARDIGAEHNAITQAALARDVDRACGLIEDHFARTASGLVNFLERDTAAD